MFICGPCFGELYHCKTSVSWCSTKTECDGHVYLWTVVSVSYTTVKRQCNDVVQRLGFVLHHHPEFYIGITHRNNGPQINISLAPSLCTTSSHWVLQWYNSPKQRSTDKHVTHTQSLYYIITLTFYSGIAHRNNGPQINMSVKPSLCTTSSHWVLQWYSSLKQRSTDRHVTHTQFLYYIITLSFTVV
jgi:hypothetical protein